MTKKKFKNLSGADKVYYIINTCVLLFSLVIVLIPLLNVVAQSLSTPGEVIKGNVLLLPKGFNFNAYKEIVKNKLLLSGFSNSFLYTILGTLINVVMTVMVAYPLSRKDFVGRGVFTAMFVFTMIFTAPLIPVYLNIKRLNMLNTIWAMVIPGAISVYNMIIARTFFQSNLPGEMLESAEIDGATDIQVLMKLVLPLSKSVLAVLVLFYAVAHWNSYFNAFIYLSSESKFPLQVVLRNILSNAQAMEEMVNTTADQGTRLAMIYVLKYAVIVFGSVPVICLYPFVQKHFVKGVMIGSVKG